MRFWNAFVKSELYCRLEISGNPSYVVSDDRHSGVFSQRILLKTCDAQLVVIILRLNILTLNLMEVEVVYYTDKGKTKFTKSK